MPVRGVRSVFLFMIFALLCLSRSILAQGTAFTYQGKLSDSGNLANGNYDLQFKLFDTATVGTGTQQGSTVTLSNVAVSNGIFTVSLDFGVCSSCFNGAARFLDIAVKPTSSGTFTTLGPRQPIAATPYALKSLNAANATTADSLSLACVTCVTSSQIQSVNGSAVTGTIPVASVPTGSTNYIQNSTSQQTTSNFNISGNGIVGGSLGIGTTSPGAALDVVGGAQPMRWARAGAGKTWAWEVDASGTYLRNATDLTLPLSILNGGNVGVGTTSPASAIDVLRPGTAEIRIKSTGGHSSLILDRGAAVQNNSSQITFYTAGSADFAMGTSQGSAGISDLSIYSYGLSDNALTIQKSSGRVGIGTTTPAYKLHVDGGSSTAVSGTSTNGDGVRGASSNAVGVRGDSTSNAGVLGFSTNNFGVSGVSTNGYGVAGSSTNSYAGYFFGSVNVTGSVSATGFITTSDARLKQNIKHLGYGLSEVLRLRPVTWRWKEHPERGQQLGLVAQEVEPVLPELVSTAKDADQTKGVNYTGLLPVLINAIQEQQQQLEKQQAHIKEQQGEIAALQQELRQGKQQKERIRQQQQEMATIKQLLCASHPRANFCKAKLSK